MHAVCAAQVRFEGHMPSWLRVGVGGICSLVRPKARIICKCQLVVRKSYYLIQVLSYRLLFRLDGTSCVRYSKEAQWPECTVNSLTGAVAVSPRQMGHVYVGSATMTDHIHLR